MRADGWMVIAGVGGVSTWESDGIDTGAGWRDGGEGGKGFRWSSVSIPRVLTLPRLSRQFKFAYYQKCIEYGIVHEPNLLGNEAKIQKQDEAMVWWRFNNNNNLEGGDNWFGNFFKISSRTMLEISKLWWWRLICNRETICLIRLLYKKMMN